VRACWPRSPTALGAAILAGVGSGMFADAAAAVDGSSPWPRSRSCRKPDAVAIYDDAYQKYLALFDAVEVALP